MSVDATNASCMRFTRGDSGRLRRLLLARLAWLDPDCVGLVAALAPGVAGFAVLLVFFGFDLVDDGVADWGLDESVCDEAVGFAGVAALSGVADCSGNAAAGTRTPAKSPQNTPAASTRHNLRPNRPTCN